MGNLYGVFSNLLPNVSERGVGRTGMKRLQRTPQYHPERECNVPELADHLRYVEYVMVHSNS